MFHETMRNIRIGMAIFVVVAGGGGYFYMRSSSERAWRETTKNQSNRVEPIVDADKSEEYRKLNQIESRDPEAALKLADAIVAKPKSDWERRFALQRRPGLILNAAVKHLAAGDNAAAQALRARLERDFPASEQVPRLRREWNRELANGATKLLASGDRAGAAAAFKELWDAGADDAQKYAFNQWAGAIRNLWFRARDTRSPEADALLLELLAVTDEPVELRQISSTLRSGTETAEQLAARGDALAKGDRPQLALAFWEAAVMRAQASAGERTRQPRGAQKSDDFERAQRAKLSTGWRQLGDRLAAGERIPYLFLTPRTAYGAAIDAGRNLAEESLAITRLLSFIATEAKRQADPFLAVTFEQLADPAFGQKSELSELGTQLTRIATEVRDAVHQHGSRLWQHRLDQAGFDPWPRVPAAVRESIDAPTAESAGGKKPAAPANEAARRKKLAEHYSTDLWHIPLAEIEPLRMLARQIYARRAIYSFRTDGDNAQTQLRWVLRDKDDPELNQAVVKTLRSRIERCRTAGDFEQFYTLAGFYAAEIGLPAPDDPFRDEFRKGLDSAIKSYRNPRNTMKLIFLLSLFAQSFPHEEAGKAARTEAFQLAFDGTRATTVDTKQEALLPSTVLNCSVELIGNKTNYHLLSFYRGPEEVLAQCWPWRRGTVVLRDGDYELVVLSPEGRINPYRGKFSTKAETRQRTYVVKSESSAQSTESWGTPTGDYKLLYAPQSLGPVTVEPKLGLPYAGKR